MSLQNFTKGLRDKATPIADRTHAAIQVYSGETNLYMPRKELILVEWALSALTTEPSARQSSKLWDFLALLWVRLDKDAQARLSRNFKLAQILIDTFKLKLDKDSINAVERAIAAITQSTMIPIASNSQAELLLIGYLSHVQGEPSNILEVLQAQVGNRKKIFKHSKQTLDALLGAANTSELLLDYFSVASLDFQCRDEDVAKVMPAIVASKTQVTERLSLLAKAHPYQVLTILSHVDFNMIDRALLKELMAEQVKLKLWSCVKFILERDPSEAASSCELLVNAMNTDFNLDLSLVLIRSTIQMRQFDNFVKLWAANFQKSEGWLSLQVLDALKEGMDQLSAVQLVDLLSTVGNLDKVLTLLSYRAVKSEKVQTLLRELYSKEDPKICLPILNLWPQVVEDRDTARDLCCSLVLLEQGHDNQSNCDKLIKKYKGPTGAIVGRFFPTLEGLSCEGLFEALKETDFQHLLSIEYLFEHPKVSSLLIEKALSSGWSSASFIRIPLEGISKSLRLKMLDLSWKQRDLEAVSHILTIPINSVQECDPKELIALAKSVDQEECEVFFDVVGKLSRSPAYKQSLGDLLKPSKSWTHACMAHLCGLDSSVLIANLDAQKDLKPSLKALARTPVELDPKQLGALIDKEGLTSDVFCLLCRCSHDWEAVTAVYIYCGYSQPQNYQDFVSQLDAEDVNALVVDAVANRRYKIIEAILASGVLGDAQLVPFITYAAQQNATNLRDLDAHELTTYFELMAKVLRDHAWASSQYSLETMVALIARVCSHDYDGTVGNPMALFQSMTLALGSALLFQRHRLKGRNHLILRGLSGLLKCLSGSQLNSEQRHKLSEFPAWLVSSSELLSNSQAAESFDRVLSLYCDPPQRTVRENSGRNNLTSSVARVRRQVAKTVGVLIANYVTVAVQYGFSSQVQQPMQHAAFAMFDVLSSTELESVIASMDNAGRPYIKAIYNAYDTQGKWKKD